MIILIGGEKSGSGKSCLAQNLAVYFALIKEASVLMVDCDPQTTTSDWIQARNNDESLPQINCIQLNGKIRNDLLSIAHNYDYLIIDCGGQDNLALRASMSVADHALIPLRPKRRDIKTVPQMEDVLSTCKMVNPKMNASFVITQCSSLPEQAHRIIEAKEVCNTYGINALDAITYSRNIYDYSEEDGKSVLELDAQGKASQEIVALAEEVLAMKPDNKYKFS